MACLLEKISCCEKTGNLLYDDWKLRTSHRCLLINNKVHHKSDTFKTPSILFERHGLKHPDWRNKGNEDCRLSCCTRSLLLLVPISFIFRQRTPPTLSGSFRMIETTDLFTHKSDRKDYNLWDCKWRCIRNNITASATRAQMLWRFRISKNWWWSWLAFLFWWLCHHELMMLRSPTKCMSPGNSWVEKIGDILEARITKNGSQICCSFWWHFFVIKSDHNFLYQEGGPENLIFPQTIENDMVPVFLFALSADIPSTSSSGWPVSKHSAPGKVKPGTTPSGDKKK